MCEVCGLRVGHEVVLADGVSDWHAVDPEYDRSRFTHIFHQTRHPLQVINSLHTILDKARQFLCKNIVPYCLDDSPLLQSMKFWYYWTRAAEDIATKTYRVEDIDTELDAICSKLGANMNGVPLDSIPRDVSSRKGSKRYGHVVWGEIEREDADLFNKIMDQAVEFGYT